MGNKLIIKNIILGLIPDFVKQLIEEPCKAIIRDRDLTIKNRQEEDKYLNLSYSQEGEDLILHRLIGNKTNGFYIDIGAHHPLRFSNTYKFYKMGWRGINIDPMPQGMKIFNEKRPRDLNLEIAISNDQKEFNKYYMFNDSALNTFNEKQAVSITNKSNYQIVNAIDIDTFKLSSVLDRYLEKDQIIDIMNIDVEGLDMSVIESNDWNKFSPHFLVIERFGTDLEDDLNCEISIRLKEHGYILIGKTVNSLIFKLKGL